MLALFGFYVLKVSVCKTLPEGLNPKTRLRSSAFMFLCVLASLSLFSLVFTPVLSYGGFTTNRTQMLLRLIKFAFLFSSCLVLGRIYFNFHFAVKVLEKVVFAAVIFIFAQFVCFYVFKTVLPPFISRLTVQDYSYLLDVNYHRSLGLFRPMSFFYEPAHFSEFCLVYLCYCLFYPHRKNKIFQAIFTTAGIVVSTSGIGVLISLLLWFCAAAASIARDDKLSGRYFLLFALLIVSLPLLLRIPFLDKAWQRLIYVKDLGIGAGALRLSAGYDVAKSLNFFRKIVGTGFGNYPPGNAVGFSYLLISVGWLGTGFCLAFFLRLIKAGGFVRAFGSCVLGLFFVSPILTTAFAFYLPFLLYSQETKPAQHETAESNSSA